ncbi:hypothetical protein [Vibrio phage VP16T]|nr:hypothetical protein [Vibrio phage VP16T]
MRDQHKKIKGYRDLSQKEIDLMNRIKEQGEQLGALLAELEGMGPDGTTPTSFRQRGECLAYAKKDLKQGIMWAVRAVALPETF